MNDIASDLPSRSGAPTAPDGPSDEARVEGMRCDFCGEAADRVRRVALDRGYERLQTRHQVRYACSACSEKKERERLEG